jgi:uncharacterized protein YjbI with pentapeptide repeats
LESEFRAEEFYREPCGLPINAFLRKSNNMMEKNKGCQVTHGEGICGRELYDEEYCIFHSQKPDKDTKLFQRKLNEIFEDESLEDYDFFKFIFPEGISFPEKISKRTSFYDALFHGVTEFSDMIFEDWVDFSATFLGKTMFWMVFFQRGASFGGSSFKCEIKFANVTFKYPSVSFMGTIFEDVLIIDEGYNNKIFSEAVVDFRYVEFLKPEKVSFQKVNLSNFRFIGTDLRKVEFVDVDWNRQEGRMMIYDEIAWPYNSGVQDFDYPLIAQVYKRLRANYEENLNFAEAGDFHIGEMECKRKSYKGWFGKNLSLTAWYKYVSNYGESYRRPLLCWILPILFLFPILFMYSGIGSVTQNVSPYIIDYDFDASSISLNKAGDWAKDYLKSFVYSLSVFSLVREKQYRPIDNWGHFWMVLESILSPVLITFFLLALRRRFRR